MDRFWNKVRQSDDSDCWIWTAYLEDGYGRFRLGDRMRRAHRVAYALLVADIPDGLQLDHLCRNRACVNPYHLEPVPPTENKRRGASPVGVNSRRSECVNGHPFDAANTINRPGGRRGCRACGREATRRYLRRLAEQKAA